MLLGSVQIPKKGKGDMNLEYIICGIAAMSAGVYSYKTGWTNRFEGHVHPVVAAFVGIVGFFILLRGFYYPSEQKRQEQYICKNCKRKFKKEHVAILCCPICDGQLVEYTAKIKKDNNKSTD